MNELRAYLRLLLRSLRLLKPRRVNIELTNACNYDCRMCLRSRMVREQQVMSADIFQRSLDFCRKGGVRSLEFAAWGESTLDPDLYERIAQAVGMGFACSLTTNGSLLDVDRLLRTGIQRVIFSLHAADPEEYARYTKATFSFEDLEAKILSMKLHPGVLSGEFKTRVAVNHYTGRPVAMDELPAGVFLADEVRVSPIFDFSEDVRRGICDVILDALVIYADGTIGLGCCWDVNADFAIGHVRQDTLRSALYSRRATAQIRRTFTSAMCRKCYDSSYLKAYAKKNVVPRREGRRDPHSLPQSLK